MTDAARDAPRAWRERTDWVPLDRPLGQLLRGVRWAALLVYFVVLVVNWHAHGVPFDRTGLLLWIGIGLGCACIGRHPMWLLWVVADFLPLAAVLIAYDRLRGWSYTVGMPTWWHPQINVDRWLFLGHEPTVVLQEYLKHQHAQWWDIAVCICYFSFFFLPYLVAAIMWLRSRADFYRWSLRFVALSFVGFGLFLLIPSAPPWAAARCTAAEVADHPNNPVCMYIDRKVPGNVLGNFHGHVSGADQWVQLITTRAFSKLHLGVADKLVEHGRGWGDAVAAVPSLHVGGTVLFVLFMWNRLNKWWRPLLVAYPILMQFSLTYGADHYVADGIAGALCAWLIHVLANRIERRQRARPAPDTLESPSESTLENECHPTAMPPHALPRGMTQSST
ncbi:MAG TPA: phosphatase PAP2 family protein [Jatrophihabitans sp.]|jgi:hypothetical protein|nr:phosphatase PAP2 family protein [Jatrophihabitans sp.]